MKNIVITLVAFIAIVGISAYGQDKKETPKTQKVYFSCDMDCLDCEQKLGDELRFTKGVKDLKVDYLTETIFVEYKTAKTDKSKIVTAIKKKEYVPKEITEKEYKKLNEKKEE